jgi:hypothetical protein
VHTPGVLRGDLTLHRRHQHARLTVSITRPVTQHFAMKALAAWTRDIDDLRLLADTIGVDSAETAMQICAEFFPDENLPPWAAAILQELFG